MKDLAWIGGRLKEVRKMLPTRKELQAGALAGLPGAISSVPDGMAASVLVGVSPVHGLYASMAGPVAGGLTSSTKLMVITTTSAAALAAGSAVSGLRPEARPGALTLLTLVAGAVMIVAGILRAGRYTRFVSHSVMTGFLTGVSANIILGQIPPLLGTTGKGSFNLAKAVDVLVHFHRINVPSVLTGAAAAALVILGARSRLAPLAAVIALAVPTIGVVLFSADSVARVRDSGAIPSGLPLPALPHLSDLTLSVIIGGLAVAAIVLVQGAGVAQAAPNLDGSISDPNKDFIAQGIGNMASGLFKGQPVGGSVGQTALNIASGGRSRWSAVFSGIWMLLILVAFSGIIGTVAQPTLAALLIVAGVSSINPGQVITILRTGTVSKVALVTTFAATLFFPVAAAVGTGVALSLILQLNQEAMDLRIVELVPDGEGRLREQPAPTEVRDHAVTLLDIYGSLLYAGARTLQVRLPDPAGVTRAAVVIRLRGRTQLGTTFFQVVDDYSGRLNASGGRLFLSGVDAGLLAQFIRIGGSEAERISALAATDVIGESSAQAYARASVWVNSGSAPADRPDRQAR